MRFLVHANGPHVGTGYGVQCAQLVQRLKADGHDVAVSCNYGHAGSMSEWRGIPVYPQGYLINSDDMVCAHADHFFAGEPGWIIPIQDLWTIENPDMAKHNVAGWCPVDHVPVPPGVLRFFKRTDAVPIAMSRFGEKWLTDAGLDPVYIPLAVDTNVYKPTPTIEVAGRTVTGRELLDIPEDAFAVGMVAMNKGWARDRKGFNEALRAFAAFWQNHQDAILYLHCDLSGAAEGINLLELAMHAGIPEHAIRHVNQYAYRIGLPAEMMAATYTTIDVLLSPSHGEGFCVPLVEAQSCGTPVIATDFSSQTELAGPQFGAAGWLVAGQDEWDPAQHASYKVPYIGLVIEALEAAYNADRAALAVTARTFAVQYDADVVYENYWRPFLKSLEPPPVVLREPMTDVAVIVPFMRDANAKRLIDSFNATNDGTAKLYLVHDNTSAWAGDATGIATGKPSTTYAEKVNYALPMVGGSFVCIVGDDCEFQPGWIEAARAVSTTADVIGTNDSEPGRTRNPDVAAGRHSDHTFFRRSYIDEQGGCLDGPGVLAPGCYHHWQVDREMIGLAKARGVFAMAHDSRIIHHHPGYDGREDLRQADSTYMLAVEHAAADEKTFRSRLPLIEQHRVTRATR